MIIKGYFSSVSPIYNKFSFGFRHMRFHQGVAFPSLSMYKGWTAMFLEPKRRVTCTYDLIIVVNAFAE